MVEDKRPASISPSRMVDSVADWSLHRVVEYLKKKDAEDRDRRYVDTHVSSRYAVWMLLDAIDELASVYGVTRAQMSRWISYHALNIMQADPRVRDLSSLYIKLRRKALEDGDMDVLDVLHGSTVYRAERSEERTVSLYLYEPWMKAEFHSRASQCGVPVFSLVQVFFMRSLLMSDRGMAGALGVFLQETARWDIWLGRRFVMLSELSRGKV